MSLSCAIALTGGIATGKSTAADIFRKLGFKIIDADKVAHAVLQEQKDTVSKLFGERYVVDGKVDRRELGKLVFADREKLKELEGLMHPLIRQKIISLSQELDKEEKPYLVDLPLFFEKSNYPIDRSILIYAPRELQLQRLMQRNGYTVKEAKSRVDAQMDIEDKKELASFLVDNSSDIEHLEAECIRVKNLI